MRQLLEHLERPFLPSRPLADEERVRASFAARLALTMAAACLLDVVSVLVARPAETLVLLALNAAALLAVAGVLAALRAGHVRAAATALASGGTSISLVALFLLGGVDHVVVVAPLMSLLTGTLLLGVRGGGALTAVTAATALVAGGLESVGYLLDDVAETPIPSAVLVAIAAGFSYLSIATYANLATAAAGEVVRVKERLAGLIDASPDGLLVLDAAGRIEQTNPAARALLGLDATAGARTVGAVPSLITLLDLPDGIHDVRLLDLTSDRLRVIEANLRTLGASRLVLLRDVTAPRAAAERERVLERELSEARRLESVGRLAAGVAHDIRNMLSVVLGNADYIAASDVSPDLREAALDVHDAVSRASRVTSQLLSFARPDEGTPRAIDVDALLREHTGMLRRLVREDTTLVITPGAGGAAVHLDPAHASQLLVNLVANARDATGPGGRIAVGTAREADRVVITVHDDGVGMDEATRARVFEPFFTTRAHGVGTGLGLATVHGIVRHAGGTVELDSAPGAGTTFRLLLPRTDDAPEVEPVPLLETRGTTEATLLVVDDDDLVLTTHVRVLRRSYQVLTAADGQEALALARSRPVDALITDVVMPGLSGWALAEALRRERPGLPVVLLSGYNETLPAGVTELPGVRYLQKPVEPVALRQAVEALLRDR